MHSPKLMQLLLPFYMCHERWALHVVIKRKVFTLSFAVFFYNSLCYIY